jgi:NAD(P)-dependent dehydrogenase (short-subunit alcohol dehydrogenase family)
MELPGTPVLITGGGTGDRAGGTQARGAAGAKVAILDVNEAAARALADEIGGLGIACDVTDGASATAALHTARAAHGPARVLVCCAGIAPGAKIVGRNGPMPLDAFRRVIDINLIGSFNLLRLAAAEMMPCEAREDGERGVVILTASIAAYEGQIGQSAYAASKAAIVGLVLPAAREFAAQGIRVNAIAPGVFETPMVGGMPDEVKKSLYATVPFPPRFGRADEFASLCRHIVENRFINGTVIRLDGANRLAAR